MATELAFIVAIVSMNVLLGTLCLAIARGDRESPALRYWGWGMLVYTIGLTAIVSFFAFPLHVLPVVGYTLIAWASVLSVKGVLSHTKYHLNRHWVALGIGLVLVVLAYNHFGPAFHPMIDFVAPTLMAIALFVMGAIFLLKALPQDAIKAARFAAVAMLFGAGVWTLRLVFLAGVFGRYEGDPTKFVTDLLAIGHILATVACTFALFSIEVRKMESALTRVAFSDALTNLPNRRATHERFQQEIARANRHGHSFAILVIDIDHFKRVNDNHGHLAGDAMLKHVASVLESGKRAEDVLGRIGGEEFVLLSVDPSLSNVMSAAERLRQQVEASSIHYNDKILSATISMGLAAYPIDGSDWDSLFTIADQRLYESKQAGRNRVTGFAARSLD